MKIVQDVSGEFAAERTLLRAVVALHERNLLRQGPPFFLTYPLPSLHLTIRRVVSRLVEGDVLHQTIEKWVGTQQQLRLSVSFQDGTVKQLSLALWEAVLAESTRLIVGVGLLAMRHHGVEELFGVVSGVQSTHPPEIFVMRHQMALSEHHCQLWRGIRWLCANLLVWEDAHQAVLPMELDGKISN